jgi:hypothetical protein
MSFRDSGYSEEAASKSGFQLLDEGDYPFKITECIGLSVTESGADMVQLKIIVGDNQLFDNRCAGVSAKSGQEYDMISPFLKAIGQKPTTEQVNNPKYWASLKGKSGQCHIVQQVIEQGTLAGKMGNKVAYYIIPRATATAQQPPKRESRPTPPSKTRAEADAMVADGVDPDDIPF